MENIISSRPSYEELKEIYNKYFTLSYLGSGTNKLALISLVCHLTNVLKAKKPDMTCWTLLYQLNKSIGEPIDDTSLKGIAILCEDMLYGTTEFPTFGLKDKEIPEKIKELISNWLPF